MFNRISIAIFATVATGSAGCNDATSDNASLSFISLDQNHPRLETDLALKLRSHIDRMEQNANFMDESSTEAKPHQRGLIFCYGLAAQNDHLNIDHKPFRNHCGIGNGILWSGLYISVGQQNVDEDLFESIVGSFKGSGILGSFSVDGQPFRSPIHRRKEVVRNSFSRDDGTGILFYLAATKDKQLAESYLNFLAKNEFFLCHKDDDVSCQVSNFRGFNYKSTLYVVYKKLFPSILANFVARSDEFSMFEMDFRSAADELVLRSSAWANRGYTLHLVSLHVYLRALTGTLTPGYADALRIIVNGSEKENLWYRYLYNYTTSGNPQEYDAIASELLSRLDHWPEGRRVQWSFQREVKEKRARTDSMGHELVLLAKLLTMPQR